MENSGKRRQRMKGDPQVAGAMSPIDMDLRL
jgi:hypothetical protein